MKIARAEVTAEIARFCMRAAQRLGLCSTYVCRHDHAVVRGILAAIGGASLVCAAISALPSRGSALEEAAYRLGTAIGMIAPVVIVGLFAQIRRKESSSKDRCYVGLDIDVYCSQTAPLQEIAVC